MSWRDEGSPLCTRSVFESDGGNPLTLDLSLGQGAWTEIFWGLVGVSNANWGGARGTSIYLRPTGGEQSVLLATGSLTNLGDYLPFGAQTTTGGTAATPPGLNSGFRGGHVLGMGSLVGGDQLRVQVLAPAATERVVVILRGRATTRQTWSPTNATLVSEADQ